MFNAHGYVYPKRDALCGVCLDYTYSVGFGIAYPRIQGNAKASQAG